VTTGFGVEFSELKSENPAPAASISEPFGEVVEVGLGRGSNVMAISHDLVAAARPQW